MTDEQIRIKIAEACGWTDISLGLGTEFRTLEGTLVKNPLSDLNAMHEAEKLLVRYDKISRYVWELERLTFWQPDYREGGDGKQYISPAAYYCVAHATARQRAEALLKTLNLWKD